MQLKDKNNDTLLNYSTDETGKIVNGISDVKIPNDFFNVSDWLDYNQDMERIACYTIQKTTRKLFYTKAKKSKKARSRKLPHSQKATNGDYFYTVK